MTRKRIFGLAAALLLSCSITGGLWAQGVEGWNSPQSDATAGRLRSDADNFIRPDAYSGLNFKGWYGMTSYTSTNLAHIGFATRIGADEEGNGGLYLGVYYGGNLWHGVTNTNYIENNIPWGTGGGRKDIPSYTNIPTLGEPSNRISILLGGFADMGIRFTIFSSYQKFSDNDFQAAGTNYKSFEAKLGSIKPQLAWSMTRNLTDNGIRPWATLDITFLNNETRYEEYEADWTSNGVQITDSRNYVQPELNLGLGGYTLVNKDGFTGSFDLDYRLIMNFYNNEFSYLDGTTWKTDTIKGLNTNGTFTERSETTNLFIPSVSGSWRGGPLSLRFKLNLDTTIISQTITNMGLNTENKLVKNGEDQSISTLRFAPNLRLGLQWRIVPRLALNAGTRLNLSRVTRVTTESEIFAYGTKNENSATKRVNTTFDNFSNPLYLGVTFNPTDNVTFEALCGSELNRISGNNNVVSIFDPSDGLFSFGSILVGLKF